MVQRGVRLRPSCVGCQGLTESGQRVLRQGEPLCHQGDPADTIFAVISGWLREVSVDADGKQIGSRLIRPGTIVGLEALARGTSPVSPVSIVALRPARVCLIDVDVARQWLADHPQDSLALAVATAADLSSIRAQLINNAHLKAEDRVMALLVDLATTDPPGRWVHLPATREQMGELLGLTTETVSRMIQRLRRQGSLEISGSRIRLAEQQTPAPA